MHIYHYTDVNGLLGIISKKSLWATDIRFLNDSMEYYAGVEALTELCSEMIETCRNSKDSVYKSATSLYKIIPKFIKNNLENRNSYITSFTSSRDNLRQWMTYCPKNSGYAIAFNKDKILISGEAERQNNIVCRLETVDYKKERVRQMLNIDSIVNNIISKKLNVEVAASEFVNDMLFHCCAIKNEEFYDEKEIRLVTQSSSQKNHPVQFRSKSGIIIPYFEYPIELDWIEEVMIGPTTNMKLARLGLEELLERNSVNCKIEESKCSLRVF